MDWMKQNKFLSGFLIVTIIGAGALGFLAFSAKGQHDEVAATYDSKLSDLQGLQTQNPFPDDENLKRMQDLQKAHQASINELQQQLAAAEIPLEPITPAGFQDELNKAVKRVLARAQEKQVSIFPEKQDKFYMAFDRYQAQPPEDAATGPLFRMLKAMELAINALIDNGGNGTQISDITREPLPEEGGARAPAPGSPKLDNKDKDKKKDLVHRHPFEISFVMQEQKFRKFLNELISNKQQFFIPKSVKIENEKVKAPSKIELNAPQPPPISAPPLPPGTPPPGQPPVPPAPAAEKIKIIVGEEKLQISLRIEVADFEKPAAPDSPKK